MGMTVYTAHVYVVAENDAAYYELSYDNEECPNIVFDDSFFYNFNDPCKRGILISKSFDTNMEWDDLDAHYIQDEIRFSGDSVLAERFDDFCEQIIKMEKIEYVLLSVDSNKCDWNGYSSYWYDAVVFDFDNECLYSIEWRGTNTEEVSEAFNDAAFSQNVAERLIEMIKNKKIELIDVGDFVVNGSKAGKVSIIQKSGTVENAKTISDNVHEENNAETKVSSEEEKILELSDEVNSIDFQNKTFVFTDLGNARTSDGMIYSPDDPEHPVVKRVIQAGGLLRRSVSGKTDYLIINMDALYPGQGAKCRDAIAQINKGNQITIISLKNLREILSEKNIPEEEWEEI